jgi:hypothetical protein
VDSHLEGELIRFALSIAVLVISSIVGFLLWLVRRLINRLEVDVKEARDVAFWCRAVLEYSGFAPTATSSVRGRGQSG